MKVILSALVAMMSLPAFANTSYVLPKGSKALSLVKGEVVSVQTQVPNCPPNAICEPVSVARIKFTLNGCLDRLGPVTYRTENRNDGKLYVHVTAFNVANEKSIVARCFAAPVAFAELFLGMGFLSEDDVRVDFASHIVPVAK